MAIFDLPFLKRWRSGLRLALDRFVDSRWGIDTIPAVDAVANAGAFSEKAGKFDDATENQPLSYLLIFRFLSRIAFKPDDVFVDIGCGNGRLLCYVARKRLAKVIGVELSPVFAARAQENALYLKGRASPIEIRCGDAAEMDYSDGTIFFLNNPFGPKTLELVLERIQKTTKSHPRPITIIYVNAFHSAVFQSAGWLDYGGESIIAGQKIELWTCQSGKRQPSNQ